MVLLKLGDDIPKMLFNIVKAQLGPCSRLALTWVCGVQVGRAKKARASYKFPETAVLDPAFGWFRV